jgi:branched-chain amino acid transport system permease protein
MLAMRENALAAETLGVNLTRTRMLAFVMGAFFAGVSGGLWAHLITAITPRSFSIIMAFNLVVMVVIGGSGSITGSILAACLLTMMVEVLRPIEEYLVVYGINEIIVSVALILILVFKPTGFFGTREPALLTRIAGGGLFRKRR